MSEDGSSAKTDPLSKATRLTKRNLLIASLVAIAFRAFDVSAEKISLVGVGITFDRGLFEFLLLVTLAYLLLSFVLYYYIDIRNFQPLDHQVESEKWHGATLHSAADKTVECSHAEAARDSNVTRLISITTGYRNQLSNWIEGYPNPVVLAWRMYRRPMDYSGLARLSRRTGTGGRLQSEEIKKPTAEDLEFLRERHRGIAKETRRFWNRYTKAWFQTRPRILTVRIAYSARNYFVDGALPVCLAFVALAALLNFLDVHWLTALASKSHPPFLHWGTR